ncbi:MAG: hypothetical protein P1U62_08955 [Alteraurantiacibacter sp. bin_em_oilr2.035]|nr:hypothetical protein [Alteraurantiacibacter sp. bin_em_oilr2.035]
MTESSGAVNGTTVTIGLPIEVHDKLARISAITQRNLASLAAEAVSDYVKQHLDDIRAGRVFSHEEVMAEMQAIVPKLNGPGKDDLQRSHA